MSDAEQYDESVKAAVELEEKRRKRALTGYLALLVVSLAVGGYAVVKAPTETSIVAAKVEPIVRDRVQASVAEGVTRDVVQRAGPRIDKIISNTFTTTVLPRIKEITGTTSSLTTRLNTIDQNVNRIDSTVITNAKVVETARSQLETFAKRSELQERFDTERASLKTEMEALVARERAALHDEIRNEVRTLLAAERSQIREAVLKEARAEITRELQPIREKIQSIENDVEEIYGKLKIDRGQKERDAIDELNDRVRLIEDRLKLSTPPN